MNCLVFPRQSFRVLREQLLASRDETAAILLARSVQTPNGWRLLIKDSIIAPEDSYTRRGRDHIELQPEFLAQVVKKARHERLSLVLTHTHPFHGLVEPSSVDRRGEAVLLPSVFRRVPDAPHARLILGRDGAHAAIFPSATSEDSAFGVQIGREIITFASDEPDTVDNDRHDRQILALGAEGQAAIRRLRIGIVGLGGTGSVVAQQLSYLGVKRFVLIDNDVVEPTNLNRIVNAVPSDVGREKIAVAADAIKRISPGSLVEEIFDSAVLHKIVRHLLDTDCFFVCTDNQGSRAVLSQFAYQYVVPAFDMGVRVDAAEGTVRQIGGRVQMLAPGLPCLICSQVLDPEQVRRDLMTDRERSEDRYIVGARVPQPAVVSLNSTVASLAITMFLSAVTTLPVRSRYQIVRFETGVVRSIGGDPDPNCVICSEHGALGRGDQWDLPGRL
jgi:molybdopterin-synthase adenylyltransferase